MTDDNTLTEELETEIDFKAVKHRFFQLNQGRLQRTRNALRDRQVDLLDLLPLLFHVNHPMLPGYSSKFTPCGVWGYEPERKELNLARTLAKSFSYTKPPKKQPPILAIYFMGSSGTIAQAEESDFDFWICHDPALDKEQLERLQQKCSGIKQWAEDLGLEIHFFLINPEEFRAGKQQALTSESSGSAQHNLLLDEFYRTSVLLTGQYPLWWLVPPEYEAAYDIYVGEMQRKRFIYARDTIDFGSLAHIPAEEFFGAALWQLSKGIDSPYKAILKLLLIEVYAREYPAVELLSKQFKRALYDGETDPERLDPYLQMLQKVLGYLQANGEQQRTALAHRCFYFKAGIRLSDEVPARRSDWRRELLKELTHAWHWTRADLMLMDARHTWRVHRVMEERQILFDALITSYRFLSDFARKYAGLSMISQRDLNTLGRKLYTAFERKAGKVEIITHGIEAQLHEAQLTLYEAISDEGEGGWQAYRGIVHQQELRLESPIKRGRHLVELLAWCHLNGVIDRDSSFMVHSSRSGHTAREIENLVARIAQHFPRTLLHSGEMQEYASAARLMCSELFINTGVRTTDAQAMTMHIAAIGHTDPFNFGHYHDNLVQALDLLSLNSWREATTQRFSGEQAVLDALCSHLAWYPPSVGIRPELPHIYGGNTAQGIAIAKRIEGLFREIIRHFYGEASRTDDHYIVNIGPSYYVFYFDGDTPRYETRRGLVSLQQYLGQPRDNHFTASFDIATLKESFLPLLYQHNKAGVVQCFFHTQGSLADIYVLDEKGSLFQQQIPFHDLDTLLGQFSRFFEAVSNRVNFLLQEGEQRGGIAGVEFYQLQNDAIGRRRMNALSPQLFQPGKSYFSLQVIVEQNSRGEATFTLYCDGREFSTLEHGKGLFDSVVKHVLMLRRSGQTYPIYITDISLDRAVVGEENVGKMQTVHYLNYKRRIEEQLNRSLRPT